MQIENVMQRFALLSGLSQNEALLWSELVCDAAAEVSAHLRSGAENDSRAQAAAAALAFYKYKTAVDSTSSVESFSAGDLSVKMTKGSAAQALELYRQCMTDCHDLMVDENFVFMSTKEI